MHNLKSLRESSFKKQTDGIIKHIKNNAVILTIAVLSLSFGYGFDIMLLKQIATIMIVVSVFYVLYLFYPVFKTLRVIKNL